MMADVDVTDVEQDDDMISVLAPHTEYFKTKTALLDAFPDTTFEIDEITFVPQVSTEISGDDIPVFEKFMAMLEDCDDVQNVYHNAIIKD